MDLQIVYLRDVLPITSVTNVPDFVPRTLDVRGPDFRRVIKVEVNEEEAPNFAIISPSQMLVQVPVSQEKQRIQSIIVLSDGFTAQEDSKLSLELTDHPRMTSGLLRLIQLFVLYLLRTPGTDAWRPKSGGGLQRFMGANFSRENSGGVSADFTLSVNRVRTQIIALQASNPKLTPDERLAACNVLSSVFSASQTALLARVELIAQSGRRAAVGLEL